MLTEKCCVGGKQVLLGSQALTLQAGAVGTITFNKFAGRFCVQRLFAIFDTSAAFAFTSWKVGAKELILDGLVSANIFGVAAQCCPVLCVDCVCEPGVPMVFGIVNGAVGPQTIQLTLIGCYEEECTPPYTGQPVAELPNRIPRTYPR